MLNNTIVVLRIVFAIFETEDFQSPLPNFSAFPLYYLPSRLRPSRWLWSLFFLLTGISPVSRYVVFDLRIPTPNKRRKRGYETLLQIRVRRTHTP